MTLEDFKAKKQAIPDEQLVEMAEKALRKLCSDGCRSFTMSIPVQITDTDVVFNEVIRRFKERQPATAIFNVKDKLPDTDGSYLVHVTSSFPKNSRWLVAEYYDDFKGFYSEASEKYLGDVTLWCFLPPENISFKPMENEKKRIVVAGVGDLMEARIAALNAQLPSLEVISMEEAQKRELTFEYKARPEFPDFCIKPIPTMVWYGSSSKNISKRAAKRAQERAAKKKR